MAGLVVHSDIIGFKSYNLDSRLTILHIYTYVGMTICTCIRACIHIYSGTYIYAHVFQMESIGRF